MRQNSHRWRMRTRNMASLWAVVEVRGGRREIVAGIRSEKRTMPTSPIPSLATTVWMKEMAGVVPAKTRKVEVVLGSSERARGSQRQWSGTWLIWVSTSNRRRQRIHPRRTKGVARSSPSWLYLSCSWRRLWLCWITISWNWCSCFQRLSKVSKIKRHPMSIRLRRLRRLRKSWGIY